MATSDDRKEQPKGQPEGTAMTDLRTMIDRIVQAEGPIYVAPKSLHQVIQDIVDELVPQMTQHAGQTLYVEPVYSLNTGALIHIQAELQSILGPTVALTIFKHIIDNNHVLFQFKT